MLYGVFGIVSLSGLSFLLHVNDGEASLSRVRSRVECSFQIEVDLNNRVGYWLYRTHQIRSDRIGSNLIRAWWWFFFLSFGVVGINTWKNEWWNQELQQYSYLPLISIYFTLPYSMYLCIPYYSMLEIKHSGNLKLITEIDSLINHQINGCWPLDG